MKFSFALSLLPLLPISLTTAEAVPGPASYLLPPTHHHNSRSKYTAGYLPGEGFNYVIELASALVAAQIVGFATERSQLQYLCNDFPFTRIEQQPYNATSIKKIFCAAAARTELEPLSVIQQILQELSMGIWVVQALGAVQGNTQTLCDIINPSAANAVALPGDLIKKEICSAAAAATRAEKSGGTQAVTFTAPLTTDIQTLEYLTLSFERVATRTKG